MSVIPTFEFHARKLGFGAAVVISLITLTWLVEPLHAATGHVHYISSHNVYIDAGRMRGVTEGATLWVMRDGKQVVQLQVEFVAQHSAACKVVAGERTVRVGDTVQFEPVASSRPAPSAAVTPQSIPPATDNSLRLDTVHGHLLTTYSVTSRSEGRYENPTLLGDLRLGSVRSEELQLRFRADRPSFQPAAAGGSLDETTRIADASIWFRSASRNLEVAGGRFVPRRLETLGTLDGGSVSFSFSDAWRLGVAAGRRPELTLATDVPRSTRVGAYLETNLARGERRLATHLSWLHEQDNEQVRRRYLILRNDARFGPRLRLYQRLEADASPTWKRDAGRPPLALTALSLSIELTRERVSYLLGADTRRPVLVPELLAVSDSISTERQAAIHGAVRVKVSNSQTLRFGGDARTEVEDRKTSFGWNASWWQSRFLHERLAARVQASGYQSELSRGTLVGGHLEMRSGNGMRLGLGTGVTSRHHRSTLLLVQERASRDRWVRLSLGLQSTARWWLDGSAEWRSSGRIESVSLQLGRAF